MLNSNLIDNKQSKRLQKKDFLFMSGFSSMLLFFSAFFNNNQNVASVIALIAVSIILIFYFAKTTKKVLTQNDIRLNIGFVGLFGSVICNLLITVHRDTAILKIVVTFVILTVASLVISILLALLINKLSKKSKNKSINITPFAFAGALFGVALSRYFNSNGIDMPIIAMIWMLNLILTILTIIQFLKLKEKSRNNQNLSGDGSMIDG